MFPSHDPVGFSDQTVVFCKVFPESKIISKDTPLSCTDYAERKGDDPKFKIPIFNEPEMPKHNDENYNDVKTWRDIAFSYMDFYDKAMRLLYEIEKGEV